MGAVNMEALLKRCRGSSLGTVVLVLCAVLSCLQIRDRPLGFGEFL
jgi:hypothetical protein